MIEFDSMFWMMREFSGEIGGAGIFDLALGG